MDFYKLEHKQKFSKTCALFSCEGNPHIIKAYPDFDKEILPIAGNEYISYKLMMLLKSKGLPVDVAEVILVGKEQNSLEQNICLIEYLGEHSRMAVMKDNIYNYSSYNWSKLGWLFWFDKWIGRLDSAGDTNLILLKKDDRIIPLDFAMSYHWACGVSERKIDVGDFNLIIRHEITKCKTIKAYNVIKSITDKEILDILQDKKLVNFVSKEKLNHYYSGLCSRRDNLN